MSEKVICDKEDLTAIADAVRANTGSAETYNVPELSAAAVEVINNGGGSPYSVLYVEQTLTDAQKAQARENIGVEIPSVEGLATETYVDNKIDAIVADVTEKFPIIAEEPEDIVYVLENSDIDTTLSVAGKVADAKTVGEALAAIGTQEEIVQRVIAALPDASEVNY